MLPPGPMGPQGSGGGEGGAPPSAPPPMGPLDGSQMGPQAQEAAMPNQPEVDASLLPNPTMDPRAR